MSGLENKLYNKPEEAEDSGTSGLVGKGVSYKTRLEELADDIETAKKEITDTKTLTAVGFIVLVIMMGSIVVDVLAHVLEKPAPIIIYQAQVPPSTK